MNRKTIFITGAANGIGRATAVFFASRGWYVGMMDIDDDGLRQLQQQLGEPNALMVAGDVTKPDEVARALDHFSAATNNRLDVLFNNAGILRAGAFGELNLEAQKAVIDINVIGVINTTYLALPMLIRTKNSYIVNMCSASAFFGNPELTVYAASKSAVKSLTEGWNIAFEKYGIHVCDLQPIYVGTSMVYDRLDALPGLKRQDIRLSPEKIAGFVWKAVHTSRIHWPIGLDTKVFRFLMRFFPDSVNRWVLKRVIKYK